MPRPMLPKVLAGFIALAAFAAPSIASADVYVYRPKPVRVHRNVVVVPLPAAHACTTRVVRVWVDGRYISRTVRTCR